MQRPLGLLVLAAVAAFVLWRAPVRSGPHPVVSDTTSREVRVVTAACEPPGVTSPVEAALDREAVAPTDPPAPPAIDATNLTFHLTGATPHELRGVAFVRRKDGSTTETAFTNGRFTASDRATLCGVSLRAPGFAIAWPKLGTNAAVLDVPMQRAGRLSVHLVDAGGRPLAHRVVFAMCQVPANASPKGVGYTANPCGVTGTSGIAHIDHASPGTYELGAARVAEWQPVIARGVVVRAGENTTCELVAKAAPPSQFGGFTFPRSAAPALTVSGNDVYSHLFVDTDGRAFMLAALGDQIRVIAHGRQGDLVTGAIAPIDIAGTGRTLPPVSMPITLTIGAVFAWSPRWLR